MFFPVSSTVSAIFKPILPLSLFLLPLQSAAVPAGFPSPAEDHVEASIDLNTEFIRHPAATFFVRVRGNSMMDAGIGDGDLLIVDKSLPAVSGSVAVCSIDGEFTLKRLKFVNRSIWLMPANPQFQPMAVSPDADFSIFGVVAHVIKTLR